MRPSVADEALAADASALLAERRRTDLSVTAVQVLKWRQRSPSALPIVSDRGPGRGRLTRYSSDAPVVAAALASALAADRHYEQAVLASFGDLAAGGYGNPMAEDAVREALDFYLRRAEAKAGQAKVRRTAGLPSLPRSERVVMPWSRRDPDGIATDTLLAVLLDEPPAYGDDGLLILANALVPGSAPTLVARTDARPRLATVLEKMTLAALRRLAKTADLQELARICADIEILFEADRLTVRLFEATGTSPALVTYPTGLRAGVEAVHAGADMVDWVAGPRGLALTVGALGIYLRNSSGSAKQRFRACVDDNAKTIPGFTEYVTWVESLPESWRRTQAPIAGNVYFSQLPKADQLALNASLRQWVKEHSDVVRDSGADFAELLADAEQGT